MKGGVARHHRFYALDVVAVDRVFELLHLLQHFDIVLRFAGNRGRLLTGRLEAPNISVATQ